MDRLRRLLCRWFGHRYEKRRLRYNLYSTHCLRCGVGDPMLAADDNNSH